MTTLTQLTTSERVARLQTIANDPDTAAKLAVELIQCVTDSDEEVRNWANEALENLESPPVSELANIAKFVASSDDDAAFWALKLLGRLGEQAQSQQVCIAAALKQERAVQVRQNAAWALGKLGSLSDDSRKRLQEAAKDADARLAHLAQQALTQK